MSALEVSTVGVIAHPQRDCADVVAAVHEWATTHGTEIISLAGTATLSKLKATSAVHRLISPSEMGELFKVLGFGKGFDVPILGFQSARHLPL